MHCKVNVRQFSGLLRILFIISFFVLLPSLSYACDTSSGGVCLDNNSNSALFTPSSEDQSIIYLGELFGSVPPILAGTGSSLLGNLFKIFNTAVMTLGILFAGYTAFVGILNTAGEGEMLGKAWSSIWIPIRTVAGIALLIPTASGYCVCQIFMMWLLVQGIGAADTLTSGIIDYMESGQMVYVPGDVPNSNEQTPIVKSWDTEPITYAYEALSCMQGLQRDYPEVNPDHIVPPSPTAADGSPANSDTNPIYYNFTANKYQSATPNTDGTYTAESISCGQMMLDSQKNMTMAPYITQGFNAIMPSLNSAAYFMVNDSANKKDTVMQDTFNFVGSDFMNEVALTYNSYVIQASNSQTQSSDSYLDSIRAYGWITIGNLYWNMAKSSDSGGISNDATDAAHIKWSNTKNIYNAPSDYDYGEKDNTQNVSTYGNDWGGQFMADLTTSRDSDIGGSKDFKPANDTSDYAMKANGMMASMTLDILNTMEHDLGSSTKNPMVAAQSLGHNISYDVEAVMTSFIAIQTAITATFSAAAWALNEPLGAYWGPDLVTMIGVEFALLLIMPFFFIFMGLLLTLASILAVVIPLIPALAFFLAAIAWLIATLETIMAAPIVAIGLIHPDGQHQVWGKAEPAIMLMINMFLRPSFMVLGMAAGVILSYISVQFVNFGYEQVMSSLLGAARTDDRQGVTWMEATMYLTTYVGLILACVNKSFSVIDALPDTVMRWISGGEATKFASGQEAAQKLQGSQESAGQKASGDSLSSGQESAQARDKANKKGDEAISRADAKKNPDSAASKLGKSK